MRLKRGQIRRQIRQHQVESYKAGVRESLLESQRREFEEGKRIMAIKRCLEEGDLSEYFSEFVASEQHLFYNLPPDLLISSYCLFIEHISCFKAACLLQQILTIHFELIFTHTPLTNTHNRTLSTLITLINAYATQIENNQLDLPSSVSCGLDCYLGILKLFFLRKHSKLFSIDLSSLIKENVLRWSQQLIQSKQYLQLLANALNNEQTAHLLKQKIQDMPKKDIFFKNLIVNIIETKGQIGSISINVLSAAVTCLKSEPFIPYFLEDWLEVLDVAFKDQSNYKHSELIEGLNILNTILSKIIENHFFVNLSHIFQTHHIFKFLTQLLSSQNEQRRVLLLSIMNLSLELILHNGEDITSLSEKQTLACLARELAGNSIALQLGALKIIAALVSADKRRDLLYVLEDLKVPLLLEQLQFHRNRQIGQLAESLLGREFFPQEYDYDTFYSDPTDPYDQYE